MSNNNLKKIKSKIQQINTTNNDFISGLEDVNNFYIEVQKKRLVDLYELYEVELAKLKGHKIVDNSAQEIEPKLVEPIKESKIVEEVVLVKEEEVEPIVIPVVEPKSQKSPEPLPKKSKHKQTLADKLLDNDRNDLNKKYKNSKISSLASSIHISKKFEFINYLFKNNAEMYKEVVGAIDELNNSQEAFEFLEKVTVEQFDWSHQEDLAADFYHFVYRRFV